MTTADKLRALESSAVPFAKEAAPAAKVVDGDFRTRLELRAPQAELARALAPLCAKNGLYLHTGMPKAFNHAGELQPMSGERFVTWIDRVATFERGEDERGLTSKTAAEILAGDEFRAALPALNRISDCPLPVRRGARLELAGEGYHEPEGLLVKTKFNLEPMSGGAALARLIDLVAEFPFRAGDEDRCASVLLAAALTPFCDFLMPAEASRPAFLAVANSEGSGKTCAWKIAMTPTLGLPAVSPPPGGRQGEVELRKQLCALIDSGAPYVFFDNWRGNVGSATLEAMLTTGGFVDRRLGAGSLVKSPRSPLVFVTGNRVTVSPDIRRRAIILDLFLETARPESRTFKRILEDGDILAMRQEVLSCLWALVRHWDEAGRKPGDVVNPQFKSWAEVIGGIIQAAGKPSPLIAPKSGSADEELEAFERLIVALLGEDMRVEIAPAVLRDRARQSGEFGFLDETEPTTGERAREENAEFGKLCQRFRGRLFAGDRVAFMDDGKAKQHRKWIVERREARL